MNTNKFRNATEVEILEKEFNSPVLLEEVKRLATTEQEYILFLTAVKYYKPHQHYHNFNHAKEVTQAVLDIYKAREETPEFCILLAAIWHDAIYIPGSKFSEKLSSNIMDLEAGNIPMLPVVYDAAAFIERTTLNDHLSTTDHYLESSILLDADLSSMGGPWKLFEHNQSSIISEQLGIHHSPSEYDLKEIESKKFLKQFLDKEYIYRTPEGRDMWEEQARKNLTRYCNS